MKSKIFITAILLSFPAFLFASEEGIQFSIRYFDKRIYYLEEDPIMVQVTITNKSAASYHFKLADERVFSVDFDVRSMNNRLIEPSESLLRRRNTSGRVFFREVSVEPGESFSFEEDLRGYVRLDNPGSYVVKARVYPELYRFERPSFLESNRLSLNIRPPALPGPDGQPLFVDPETRETLRREHMPPDEVITYLLNARRKEQWDKFFLYLDLQSIMLARDPRIKRRWDAAGEEERRKMLIDFRDELQKSRIDGDIASIPSEFVIERTVYSGTTGTVTVREKFRESGYTAIRRYEYKLRRENIFNSSLDPLEGEPGENRKNDVWMVTDYTVMNLGTE